MSIYTLLRGKVAMLVIFTFALLFSSVANAQISLTATAGTTTGTYTTLRAAVLAINAGTHQGIINISVTANTTETALSTLNQSGSGSSSYTSITIKPAASTTPIISGSVATGILYIKGSNVTIDGSNTVGGVSRDMTIKNTNTASNYVIRLGSPSTTLGATNNTIKNCTVMNASITGTGNVIISGGATLYNPSDAPNSNNTIQNNAISGAQEGILIYGSATPETNWLITGNTISSCGIDGLFFWQATNYTISNNTITGVSINGTSAVTGMSFSYLLSNGNIFGNNVSTISNSNTTTSYGTYGMYFDLDPATTNFNVYNNFISNVYCRANATLSLNGHGIYMDYGAGLNLYHNTIDLTTDQIGTPASGNTAALSFDQILAGGIPANAVKVKDNILVSNQTAGNRYGIYSTAASTIFSSIDYNDYYGATGLGYIGSARTTIAQMQTGFGGNVNSITYNPAFTSTTDLHLTTAAANTVLAAGTPIASPAITTDIDGNTRSTTIPTMGADEIVANTITYTTLASTCSTGDIILSGASITSGVGVPVTGATVPQIYFRKNAGTWFHASGTLASGTGTAGTWNFTIAAATMGGVAGGDVISYYVVAQTTGGTVFANPSAGLVATDVNTVTTAPTTPNTYTITAVALTGLTTTQSICYAPAIAGSVSYAFTGSTGTPNQYTLTWSPSGSLTDVVAFTTLSASPLTVSVPAGTAPNTYTGTLTVKNSTTGCTNTYTLTLTVVAPPAAITGLFNLCTGGATTTLNDATAGGTWSGGSTSVATITASGMVTSVGVGTTVVTYTAPVTGCTDTALVTVISLPNPITGSMIVCYGGGTTTLSETTGGGAWSSSPTSIATVDASGVVYGVSSGSVNISYIMPSGCYVTAAVTVNPPLAAITGPSTVCVGSTISLNDATTGGSWTSAATATATVTTGGVVSGVLAGSSTTITYSTSVGCNAYKTITVNPLPSPIDATVGVCENGGVITLTDPSGTGTWTTTTPTTTALLSTGGVLTGVSAGAATVTFTLAATGCSVTAPIAVNPLPAPIGGATSVCANGTATVTETTSGGTWGSGAGTNATVDAAGLVTGVATGTQLITYTITATGCAISTNITVLAAPAAITGTASVCEAGGTTTLADVTTPGTWSVTPAGTAAITASGMVTGGSAGTATVTYTSSNSCYVTQAVTVNPLPATITGPSSVCQTSTVTLSSTAGGSWLVGNPFVATVSSGGGVTGLAPGTSGITYTLPTGCRTTSSIVVNTIPGPINGNTAICIGGIATFSNTVGGGTWTSSAPGIASIEASTGIAHGLSIGSATLSYTTGTSGCYVTLPVTVTSIVVPTVSLGVSPSTSVCADTLVTFTPTITNGGPSPLYVWSVNHMILSGASTYAYHPHDGDEVRLWIRSNYGCAVPDTAGAWVTMTVHPIVTPGVSLAIAGGDTICIGNLAIVNAVPVHGGTAPSYQWYINSVAVATGPTYPFIPTNGDVVSVTMTSNDFCRTAPTATTTKILTVSPYVTPFASLNSSLGLTVCEGYPEVFTATSVNGGTAPTYQWSVNGSNTTTGTTYVYAPVNGDNVQVTVTSNFPCLTTPTGSASASITVLPITQPAGIVSAVPGYIIPAGMNDTFTCTVTSGGGIAPLYQWYIQNIPQPGATNSVFITNHLISGDSVSCEVTNTDQCSGVVTFAALHIIVGNNVGINNLSTDMALALVPNPNNGTFTIKGNLGTQGSEAVTIYITNMLGQKVYTSTATTTNGELNQQLLLNSTLANGVYQLHLQSEHTSKTFHFVLEK